MSRQGLTLLAAGLATGLLAATLMGPAIGTARAQSDTDILARLVDVGTINVNGVGRVKITPDVADVQLGVTVQGETAQEASDEAARLMDAVIAAVIAAGIPEADIQTTQLNLYPVYDYNDNPPQIEGWEASNIVTVTVRDVSTVGDVVGAATAAGATNVQGITFRVDDPSEAEAQARSAAVADARAKAEQLAADAGVVDRGRAQHHRGQLQPAPADRLRAVDGRGRGRVRHRGPAGAPGPDGDLGHGRGAIRDRVGAPPASSNRPRDVGNVPGPCHVRSGA